MSPLAAIAITAMVCFPRVSGDEPSSDLQAELDLYVFPA